MRPWPQTLFTLEHPDRIVIDLRNTHRAAACTRPRRAGAVSAVRFGIQPGGTLRVVLETDTTLAAPGATCAGGRTVTCSPRRSWCSRVSARARQPQTGACRARPR